MAFVNIPPNLQDMFYQVTDRIAKLETGPNQAMVFAESAQTVSAAAFQAAVSSQSVATNAQIQAINAGIAANSAASQATIAQSQATIASVLAASASSQATSASAQATSAQTTAALAQTTANGKNKVYYSLLTPGTTANQVGDIWYQYGASGTYANKVIAQWTGAGGTSWTPVTVSGLVIANIDAGSITTGTLSAIQIQAGSGGQYFTVSPTGFMSAQGVYVKGNITADSGTFTGTIQAGTGYFGSFAGGNYWSIGASGITGVGTATITGGLIQGSSINVPQTSPLFQVNSLGQIIAQAGTIGGVTISSNALTGGTIQTSSGSTAIIMNGASNALQFKVSGSVSGNIVPLGVAGVLMHYGSTPDSTGSTYPKVQMSFSTALLAATASIYVQSTTTGNSASGDFRCFNAFQVDGNATFNGLMYAPNLGTSTSATNLRVATGTIGEIQETTASSIRFKENIVDLNTVFDLDPKKLLDLPVRAFTYKANYLSENDDRFEHMLPGFIAEEVDAIYPVAADYDGEGPRSWNERFIIPGMLSLLQDLYSRVKALEA